MTPPSTSESSTSTETIGIGNSAPRLSWTERRSGAIRLRDRDPFTTATTSSRSAPRRRDDSHLRPGPGGRSRRAKRAIVRVRVLASTGATPPSAWSDAAARRGRTARRSPTGSSTGRVPVGGRCRSTPRARHTSCAPSSNRSATVRQRPHLRHRTRRLRPRGQRRPDRRRDPRARLDAAIGTASATARIDLDDPAHARGATSSGSGSPTAGTAADSDSTAACGTSTATMSRSSCSSRSRMTGRAGVVPLEWTRAPSPIIATGLYEGETHDARRSQPAAGPLRASMPSAWRPDTTRSARPVLGGASRRPPGPPVRIVEALAPSHGRTRRRRSHPRRLRSEHLRKGADRRSRRRAAHEIELHHAEVSRTTSSATRPLRTATSVDRYTFRPTTSTSTWTPRFTLHGFRYAEIERSGRRMPGSDSIEALVVHSDMRRSGWFSLQQPPARQVPRERRLEHARQLRRPPDGLPPARRTARVERRHPGLRSGGDLPVRLHRRAAELAARSRCRAGRVRLGPELPSVDRLRIPERPRRRVGRRRRDRPVDALPAHRRRADPRRPIQPACAPGSTRSHELTGGTGHWNTGFQLGDWLDPAAPPDRPGDSRTDPRPRGDGVPRPHRTDRSASGRAPR